MFAGGQKISGSMAQKSVSWRPIPHEMEESLNKVTGFDQNIGPVDEDFLRLNAGFNPFYSITVLLQKSDVVI